MKKNKGMTLVELVVSLAIMAILFASIATLLFMSLGAFSNISDSNQDKMIADSLYILVSDKIITASNVEIVSPQSIIINDTETISISEDGKIIINGSGLYSDEFYQSRTVSMSVSQYESDKVSIYIYIYNENKLSYSTGSVVKMLNYEFS